VGLNRDRTHSLADFLGDEDKEEQIVVDLDLVEEAKEGSEDEDDEEEEEREEEEGNDDGIKQPESNASVSSPIPFETAPPSELAPPPPSSSESDNDD